MGAAQKLRDRMQRSKDGWTFKQLRSLYEGHGFDCTDRAKHRVCRHPDYPWLRAVLGRDGKASAAYIEDALGFLDDLDRERAKDGQ